jgi:ribosome-binding protein aMBF1 (putative translation factor)
MTNSILSHSGSSVHIGSSMTNGSAQVTSTAAKPGAVVHLEFSVKPTPLSQKNKRFGGLLDRIKNDANLHSEMQDARAWVADTLLSPEGETIRSLRLQKGWSQQDFADRLSTTQAQIARIEKGNTDPRRSTCKKIREVLGITAEKLDEIMERQERIHESRNEK